MKGPDPIPIGRAKLKPQIFQVCYEHVDNYDGGSVAGAQFSPNHQYYISVTSILTCPT